MNTVVVYCSQTGFTEKYAKWLAEDLSCEAVRYSERGLIDLSQCLLVSAICGKSQKDDQ